MKIIHTADWHLGQTFYGYERTYEHRIFLDRLTTIIVENNIDVLLIAGDIFDSPNPSAESQKTFFDFICTLINKQPGLRIIITAGNHDSGARLEAPSPILESFNVIIRGIVTRNAEGETEYNRLIIPLSNDTCCLAVPYLRQNDYPNNITYNDGVNQFYSTLYEIAKKQFTTIIAMGHMHVAGGEISQGDRSERTVVGGLDCVNITQLAENFDYMALGHLHKAQRVAGKEHIRYSGAPLPMSFAERNNKQSVTCITFEKNKKKIEKIDIETPVKLISIPQEPKPIPKVLEALCVLPKGETDENSPFIEIRVLITEPEPTLRQQIETAIENCSVRLTRIEAVSEHSKSHIETPLTYDELKDIDPMELAINVFKQNYGQDDMPLKMKEMLNEVINEVKSKL